MTARTANSLQARSSAEPASVMYLKEQPASPHEKACEGLINDLPAIIMSIDGRGFLTGGNKRWHEFWGYAPGEVSKLHLKDLLTPESHKYLLEQVYEDFFRSGASHGVNVTCVLKDGSQKSGLFSSRGEKDQSGRICHTMLVMQDVTREKAAELALRQSEDRFRGSFETAAHGMALVSPDGRLLAANAMLCSLFNSDEAQIKRQSLQNLVEETDKPVLLNNVGRILAGECTSAQMELRYIPESGALVWGLTTISVVHDAAGMVAHFVVQIVDMTGRRETEERLKHAHKMEAVGQLTGGIAHDFNNLLQVVIGNLQLVQSSLPTETTQKYAHDALEAAVRGSELTRQLLAFSRRQSLAPEEILVNQMIEGMNSIINRTIGESIQFKSDLMHGDARILADLSQLESVLLNLAINARDAMPQGGHLTIETSATYLDESNADGHEDVIPGHYVMLAVSDTGTGIPADILESVFEPFFTTKEEGQGSGLGLSMTYGFIKQSGGHIKIYSEPGQGTSVKMYLPRTDVEHLSDDAPGGDQTDAAEKKTILVVEDQTDVRNVAVRFLESFGYEVLQAEDGITALGILQAGRHVDLLFTDVVMPGGMNGFDLSQAACALDPALKVIHASGYPKGALFHQQEDKIRDSLITKPYRKEELQQVIEDALCEPEATA